LEPSTTPRFRSSWWSPSQVAVRRFTGISYDEVVYFISGRADWTANGQEREAKAGDVFVVKAGEPHKFVSSHRDPVRQIDIQLSATFEQEALE
jgi:mannose-6-phosphate isomerase-like protein (cupin superfamily)